MSPRSRQATVTTADAMPGIVVRAFGLFFAVQLEDGRELLSTVSGTLKRQRRGTDIVAAGDRVRVVDVGEGEGRIVEVLPRTRALSRLARHTNDVEQVILANPDQALFLFAARNPDPHPRLLDRFLVMAESRDLPALIGINKMDLDRVDAGSGASAAHAMFDRYAPFYPTFFLSARSGEGLSDLRQALHGKITAVAGPSGVGKSSLLNVLDPTRERLVGPSGTAGRFRCRRRRRQFLCPLRLQRARSGRLPYSAADLFRASAHRFAGLIGVSSQLRFCCYLQMRMGCK